MGGGGWERGGFGSAGIVRHLVSLAGLSSVTYTCRSPPVHANTPCPRVYTPIRRAPTCTRQYAVPPRAESRPAVHPTHTTPAGGEGGPKVKLSFAAKEVVGGGAIKPGDHVSFHIATNLQVGMLLWEAVWRLMGGGRGLVLSSPVPWGWVPAVLGPPVHAVPWSGCCWSHAPPCSPLPHALQAAKAAAAASTPAAALFAGKRAVQVGVVRPPGTVATVSRERQFGFITFLDPGTTPTTPASPTSGAAAGGSGDGSAADSSSAPAPAAAPLAPPPGLVTASRSSSTSSEGAVVAGRQQAQRIFFHFNEVGRGPYHKRVLMRVAGPRGNCLAGEWVVLG